MNMKLDKLVLTLCLALLLVGCATRNYENLPSRDARPIKEPTLTSSVSPTFNQKLMPKLAVVVLEPKFSKVLSDAGRGVEDTMMGALLERGFQLATRDDVETLLVEIHFQRDSTLTDKDAVRWGKMLNVQGMLIVKWEWEVEQFRAGRVGEWRYLGMPYPKVNFATRAGLGVRLVAVESAEVKWVGRFDLEQDLPTQASPSDVLRKGAIVLAERLPKTP
jgi:curli biogenesis system outer membrane secretion channel CsgG